MLDQRQTCLCEVAKALVRYRTNNQHMRRYPVTHVDVRMAVEDGYRIMPEIDQVDRDAVCVELASYFNLGPIGR